MRPLHETKVVSVSVSARARLREPSLRACLYACMPYAPGGERLRNLRRSTVRFTDNTCLFRLASYTRRHQAGYNKVSLQKSLRLPRTNIRMTAYAHISTRWGKLILPHSRSHREHPIARVNLQTLLCAARDTAAFPCSEVCPKEISSLLSVPQSPSEETNPTRSTRAIGACVFTGNTSNTNRDSRRRESCFRVLPTTKWMFAERSLFGDKIPGFPCFAGQAFWEIGRATESLAPASSLWYSPTRLKTNTSRENRMNLPWHHSSRSASRFLGDKRQKPKPAVLSERVVQDVRRAANSRHSTLDKG